MKARLLPLAYVLIGLTTLLAIRVTYDQVVSFRSKEESHKGQETYLMLVDALDRYIASTGQLPQSLHDLEITNPLVGLDKFEYVPSGSKCRIVFHGTRVTFLHILNYGDQITRTNKYNRN